MRLYEAENAWHEPTLWVDTDPPMPVLQRCALEADQRQHWPHIVRALTAGPTMETAREVVATLNAENRALLEANSDLEAANADLNRELTDLRRTHG